MTRTSYIQNKDELSTVYGFQYRSTQTLLVLGSVDEI